MRNDNVIQTEILVIHYNIMFVIKLYTYTRFHDIHCPVLGNRIVYLIIIATMYRYNGSETVQ